MTQDPQQPIPPADPSTEDDSAAAEPFIVALPDESTSGRDWYLWAGVMALLIMVTFGPAISGGFLWNDDQNVTQNAAVRQPQKGLQMIWAPDTLQSQYTPVTQTTFWIEYQLWRNTPLGYRIVNLVIHAGAAIVLWRLLRRLSLPGAWLIAALWAVHPLQTESVSWVSQRGNVLSGLLAFSSVLFYFEFAGLRDPSSQTMLWKLANKWQAYGISLVFFAMAMLSKSFVCGLPVVILLVLWWKRKLNVETFAALIPLFIISAVLSAITIHMETNPAGPIAAAGRPWDIAFPQRVLVAGQAIWFYVVKLLLPIHQSFNYDKTIPDASDFTQWLIAGAAVVAALGCLILVPKLGRGPLVAVLSYFVLIFPLLGFINVYPMLYSFVWDHFQYLAGVPLIALLVCFLAQFVPAPPAKAPQPSETDGTKQAGEMSMAVVVPAALAAILVGVLATGSWLRAQVFVSNASLWDDTVAKNPQSWFGAYKLAQEQMKLASDYLDQGATLAKSDPTDADATNKVALDTLGVAEALLQKTVNNPSASDYTRMQAYAQLGACQNLRAEVPNANIQSLMESARRYLGQAIALEQQDERYPDALPYFTMGVSTVTLGQYLEGKLTPDAVSAATRPTQKAPSTTRPATPDEAKILDMFEEARGYFSSAIKVAEAGLNQPSTYTESVRVLELAAYNRGNLDFQLAGLVLQRGDMHQTDVYNKDAIADYALVLRVNPQKVDAHYKIALCFERFHQWDDAMAHLKTIVYSLDHYHYRAYNEIGNVLLARPQATLSDLDLAIQCFKDSLRLNPRFADAQDNLAKALIVLKDFHSASSRPSTATEPTPAS